MKLSIVIGESKPTWHIQQIIEESKNYPDVEVSIINFNNLNNIKKSISELGDVVFWRSSNLDITTQRTAILESISQKIIINRGILTYPFVTHKLYQQKVIETKSGLPYIPTYTFKSKEEILEYIEKGILKFPFIQKPNLGAKGNSVKLINNVEEIISDKEKIKKQVYQNFIKNDGDYRVFMIGGRMVGVVKRVGGEDTILNNISKGGSGFKEENEKILKDLRKIGEEVATIFNLQICGVDVIYDIEKDKCYFMEVNTVPQWRGLQEATGINIAKEIFEYFISLNDRTTKPAHILVKEYMDKSIKLLSFANQSHYYSRLYLWSKDNEASSFFEQNKKRIIGENLDETHEIIKRILNSKRQKQFPEDTEDNIVRNSLFQKYPNLGKYKNVLFKYLFAKSIYNIDIKHVIEEELDINLLIDLKDELIKNIKDLSQLSTFGVNYLYMLSNFLEEDIEFSLIESMLSSENFNQFSKSTSSKLSLYLIFHSIIGKSKFYYKEITTEIEEYTSILKQAEDIIYKDYFNISIDLKLEFIICTRLLKYNSFLEKIINNELKDSLSSLGNYLVDKYNSKIKPPKKFFTVSKHRNLLYILSTTNMMPENNQ